VASAEGAAVIKRLHYSGKVTNNSQLYLGVYLNGKIEGALSFGPGIDRRKTLGLVDGTPWNGFLELNRFALSERLPKNSESRALAVSMRLLRKHAPHVKWVLSYADAAQCGDGTIYRASGFLLTGIKKNTSMWRMPDGDVVAAGLVFSPSFSPNAGPGSLKAKYGIRGGEGVRAFLDRIGAEPIPGFQMRYIRFLDPAWRDRLTVPVLPYAAIADHDAAMYRGERASEA